MINRGYRSVAKGIAISTLAVFALEVSILQASGEPPTAPSNPRIVSGVDLTNLPLTIFEEGIENWVVDRFAGNNAAGTWLYQGPAREVGGLQLPKYAVEGGGGEIYLTVGIEGAPVPTLLKVSSNGMLRVLMEADGLVEGPMGECQAGFPIWNPSDNSLYLTGPNCLRKVVQNPNGSRSVVVVAGRPGTSGNQDGPAMTATLKTPQNRGVVCNSRGTFYWFEDSNVALGLRRIENGTVSTVPLKFAVQGAGDYLDVSFGEGGLGLGENDDTLYITSFWGNKAVYRCDLRTGTLTRVIGIQAPDTYNRGGLESDGPALTHAGSSGGMKSFYNAFYNAIWVWGPDHTRFRWMRLGGDGWVRTVFGALRPGTTPQPFGIAELNSTGISGEQFRLYLPQVAGVDSVGGVFVIGWSDQSGVWRAHRR